MEHVFENNMVVYDDPNIVLIMAGGLGKRMNSDIPKVLHVLNGLPLIVHVVKSALLINDSPIIYIIVGSFRDQIEMSVNAHFGFNSRIRFIDQPEPLGTGHAIRCCIKELNEYSKKVKVLILSGDVPLFSAKYMCELLTTCRKTTIVSTTIENPFGYGRIIEKDGKFVRITEEKDCSEEEKAICKVNCGIYVFENELLCKNVPLIKNNNAQNEYYLTSIFETIECEVDLFEVSSENQHQVCGINTREQLEQMRFKSD